MPPPWATNPAPRTESAREARKAFYCDLCQKGYSRINEFEAHEGSYDHQHKKRLKEMKSLTRDPTATARARRAEERATMTEMGGIGISIKPISFSTVSEKDGAANENKSGLKGSGGGNKSSSGSNTGFKKGGFKNANAFAPVPTDQNLDSGTTSAREDETHKVSEVQAEDQSSHVKGGRVVGDEQIGEDEDDDNDDDGKKWGDYDPRRPTGCGEACFV